MVLAGNSMGIAVKFGINTTLVALKMEISMQNSCYLSQISLLPMLVLMIQHLKVNLKTNAT